MALENDNKNLRETFSQRLQWARKMRGYSVAELVSRLGGTPSTTAIEKYEKGLMFPQDSSILIALATTLDVPVGDLIRPIELQVNMDNFSFRKKYKLRKKLIDSLLLEIRQRVEKYFEIEDIAHSTIPYTQGKTTYLVDCEALARQAAMELRQAWSLGEMPIASPLLLLEEHGVKVIEVEADPQFFDGSSNTVNGVPIVVVNKKLSSDGSSQEERGRLTDFHEFGHQYLSFPQDIDEKREEDLCNVFANEMLIPSSVFIRLVGDKRKSIMAVELRNIQQIYGISGRALMMKARQLDIISESAYKWFCISLNKNPKLKAYVDTCIWNQSHTHRFEQLVYRMMATGTITQGKAAELLGITTGALNDKLNIS